MGLLDGYPFDFYGNQPTPAGGLLGMLLRNTPDLPMPQAGGGFPAQNLPPTDVSAASVQPQQPPPQPQSQNPFSGLLGGLGSLFSPSQANAAPMQQAPQQASPGLLDRLTAGATNLTTGGNPIAGLFNAIGGLTTGQRTDPMGILQQQQAATAHALLPALMANGMPPQQAMALAQAAALNPEVLKTVAPNLYTKPEFKTIKNALGEDVPIFANADRQSITYPSVSGNAGNVPGGPASPGMLQQSFDQITTARDSGAPQQDLIKMVPNSLQDPVSAVLQGKALPSNYSMRGQARDTMLKYAHAIDPNFDETTIPMRTTFAHGMAQTTPNSNGGQKLLLNTALQHLASWADHYVALNNKGAGIASSIPGSEYAASAYNALGNSKTDYSEHVNAVNDFATKVAGETGKLYSGQSGGGEREREETHARLGANQSPQSAIGALEATREAILGKLNSLQNQRDQAYGTAGENIYPLVDKETQVALKKIDAAIAKLRGQGGEGTAAAPTLPQGWSVKVH